MRFYFAGGESGTYKCLDDIDNLAFLVSYWGLRNKINNDDNIVNWANERNIPVLLDSGAYSAFTQNKVIDVYEYISFCKEHSSKFEHIVGLDVIGNPDETRKNWDIMISEGVNCWPTFHIDCEFDNLEYFLRNSNYIALGIAGQKSARNKLQKWFDDCFKLRNKINPDCKIHGFAISSSSLMSKFPFYSCDSTSWMKGQTRGLLIVNEGKKLAQYLRHDWHKAKKEIPDYVKVPSKGEGMWYCPLVRWNVQEIINWIKENKPEYNGEYQSNTLTLWDLL